MDNWYNYVIKTKCLKMNQLYIKTLKFNWIIKTTFWLFEITIIQRQSKRK